MSVPTTQHAIQITGPDEILVNPDKAVDPVGPTQMLLKVEACGICFSDTKLLHAFADHPRKSEIVSGIGADELAHIPSYHPGSEPTVPGHEPVGRIVAVGDEVKHFSVGDRVLVQADWKHLRTARSNGAFGYNFEGALQEYVVIDEACVVSPTGEEFLLHVADEPSAAAVGLIEPWATVEAAYATKERQKPLEGGRALVVRDEGATATEVEKLNLDDALSVDANSLPTGETFDDIVYFGSDPDMVGKLGPLLGKNGLLAIVQGGKTFQAPASIDVGRVHYDGIRICGTPGFDPGEAYEWIPATGEIRPGDKVAIIGAAGPMGLMHTMRTVTLGSDGITAGAVDATDLNDDRLAHLAAVVDPVARDRMIAVRYVNTTTTPLEPAFYDYVTCMVPVPALVAQAVTLAGDGGIVNAFAGIPAGTTADVDLDHLIANHVYLIGSSGSDVPDMATVLRKIESGVVDTTISLDAICGIAGFRDAIQSVIDRTSGGKIMVFPSLHDLGLIRLVDLPEKLPNVAAKLVDGRWTPEAEKELLG